MYAPPVGTVDLPGRASNQPLNLSDILEEFEHCAVVPLRLLPLRPVRSTSN